jgi:hypothetical protein
MSEWISVDDSLPKEDQSVLVFTEENDFDVMWHHNSFWRGCFNTTAAVTHWMPLPKPPSDA